MQTTLRIDDTVYRAAKAAAAQEGVTLTVFIEQALRGRLQQNLPLKPLPMIDSGIRIPADFDLRAAILAANEEQTDTEIQALFAGRRA